MQKRLLCKIDYVCKIPLGGGAGSFLAGSLLGQNCGIWLYVPLINAFSSTAHKIEDGQSYPHPNKKSQ